MPEKIKNLSLDEFKGLRTTTSVQSALRTIKGGGSFMCCHTSFYAQTGMWIPELVPVFKKMDAMLAVTKLPAGLKA